MEEFGKWPLAQNSSNYAYDRVPVHRTDIKPLIISQPLGPSYKLDGNHISWQKWDFVIGFNAREGLTLHNVQYEEDGKKRPILYR
jgi:primary-amine oxidase